MFTQPNIGERFCCIKKSAVAFDDFSSSDSAIFFAQDFAGYFLEKIAAFSFSNIGFIILLGGNIGGGMHSFQQDICKTLTQYALIPVLLT